MTRRKEWSLLVKGTHQCNLNCLHCYDKPSRDKYKDAKMSIELVDYIARLSSEYSEKVNWIWHGGEPTLMGCDWYKEVQDVFYKYYSSSFMQYMQSNGILLDESWAKLSRDYDLDIGVSYDVMSQSFVRTGHMDFDFAKTAEIFKKYTKNIGTITVINDYNHDKMIEMYTALKEIGSDRCFAFNTIFKSEEAEKNTLEFSSVEQYADSFRNYYKYWMYDDHMGCEERLAMEATKHIVGNRNICCSNSDCRYNWLCIGPTGDVYPCDRDYPEIYLIGNIFDFNSIEEIYDSSGYQRYYNDIQKRFDNYCSKCDYFMYCCGGCNANHSTAKGSLDKLDETVCDVFISRFVQAYDILRDVDVYKDKININVIKLAIDHPFFFMKEIKDFLEKHDYKVNLIYSTNPDKLLKSSEFKLFRVFNVYKGNDVAGHSDFYEYCMNVDLDLCSDFDINSVKDKRYSIMEEILKKNKEQIDKILCER